MAEGPRRQKQWTRGQKKGKNVKNPPAIMHLLLHSKPAHMNEVQIKY